MSNTERETLWQERVARWRKSGMPQRAFALEDGYPVRQVGYWVRRLSAVPTMAALEPITVQGVAAVPPAMKPCGCKVALRSLWDNCD